jgi:uncharacterized RDD family membrane protein YckC
VTAIQPAGDVEVADLHHVAPDRDLRLQGHYAGFFSRLGGFVVDLLLIVLIFDVVTSAIQFVISTLIGHTTRLNQLPVLPWLIFTLWALAYLIYPVGAVGKTAGMSLVGLRIVKPDGSSVGTREAVIRLIALPLSFIILCYGFVMILVHADHRALHDRIGGTAVVYDWDARAARVRWLAEKATDSS